MAAVKLSGVVLFHAIQFKVLRPIGILYKKSTSASVICPTCCAVLFVEMYYYLHDDIRK